MKGLNALLGWLLMLAVLAVPSFLFYNWWTKNRTQTAAEAVTVTSVKDVFSAADQHAGEAAAAQVSPAAAAPVRPAVQAAAQAPAAEPVQAAVPAPAAAPAGQQRIPVPAAAPQAAPVTAASTQTIKGSYYNPKLSRNPMLSPDDYRHMKEDELRRAEEERQARLSRNRHAKEAGIETRIRLQGIVGNAAIINGEMYTAGQTVYGGKLVKIGTDYIIGEYKGKRFTIKLR